MSRATVQQAMPVPQKVSSLFSQKHDFYTEFRKVMAQVFQENGFDCESGNPMHPHCPQFVMSHGNACSACCFAVRAPVYMKVKVTITEGHQSVTVCLARGGQKWNAFTQGPIGAERAQSKFSKLKSQMSMVLTTCLNNNRTTFYNAPLQLVVA